MQLGKKWERIKLQDSQLEGRSDWHGYIAASSCMENFFVLTKFFLLLRVIKIGCLTIYVVKYDRDSFNFHRPFIIVYKSLHCKAFSSGLN